MLVEFDRVSHRVKQNLIDYLPVGQVLLYITTRCIQLLSNQVVVHIAG